MSVLRRIARGFEADVASIILALMLFVMALQVFTRYVLNNSPDWTEEILRYMYVWVVFLGTSAAITDRSHVSISFLVEKLPRNLQIVVAVLTNAVIVVFLGCLLWLGIKATISHNVVPLMTVDVMYSVVYAIVPVTAVLMMLRTFAVMWDDVVHHHAASDDTPKAVL
jgi:TRAP-type C4-dicarboxylate transport system permease small subunit